MGSIDAYPSDNLPVQGEILLELGEYRSFVWTKNSNNDLAVLVGGYHSVYHNFYYVAEVYDFLDVNIDTVSLAVGQILKYSNGEWINTYATLVNLIPQHYDLYINNIISTNQTKQYSTLPRNGDALTFIKNSEVSIFWGIKNTQTTGSISTLANGTWAFIPETSVNNNYNRLYVSGRAANGTSIANQVRNFINTTSLISLKIDNNTIINVPILGVSDFMSFGNNYALFYLAKRTYKSNITYTHLIPNLSTTTLNIEFLSMFENDDQLKQGNLINLNDGGDFNTTGALEVLKRPDGGYLKPNDGYLYTNFGVSNETQFNPGQYYAFTNSFRLAYTTTNFQKFLVSEYGGLNQPISSPGLKLTVYGNSYAGTYYLQSSGNWSLSTSYYSISLIPPSGVSSIYSLLNQSTAIEIHRRPPFEYRWET